MINAITKLIDPGKLKKVSAVLFSDSKFSRVLCSWQSFLGACFIILVFILPSSLEARQEAASKDPSFAHIIISPASRTKADPNAAGFVSLPEIVRETMYRYFGRTYLPGAEPGTITKPEKTENLTSLLHQESNIKSKISLNNKGNVNDWVNTLKVEPGFLQSAGVFVTLSKNGKTRACWGSVYPREAGIARETVIATLGALTRDYRFKPVQVSELKDLKVQVTVIRGLEAVSNIKLVNPFKFNHYELTIDHQPKPHT